MNEAQEQAKAQLVAALQRATESGLFKVMRSAVVRTTACGSYTTVQCIIMADTDEIASCVENRIASPTFMELLGERSNMVHELNLSRAASKGSPTTNMNDTDRVSRAS